jgi:hypothetical protein
VRREATLGFIDLDLAAVSCVRVYEYPARFPAIEVTCGTHQILCQRGDRAIFQPSQFTPVANNVPAA